MPVMRPRIILSALLVSSILSFQFSNGPSIASYSIKAERTILAIFAHPDDEIMVSPILSKYAREGVHVYLAIATSGQQGVTPHAHIPAGDSLGKVRTEEARCAALGLHINPPLMLGLQDGKLATNESFALLHRKVDSLFNALKPDIVLTWGPDGGYGHPDHRAVSNIVTEVYQLGGTNQPKKLLYPGFPNETLKDLPAFKTFVGSWLRNSFHTTDQRYLNYQIPYDVQDFNNAKTSYGCHQSQWTPDMVDDIFVLLGHAGRTVYLRSWFGDTGQKKDLFD